MTNPDTQPPMLPLALCLPPCAPRLPARKAHYRCRRRREAQASKSSESDHSDLPVARWSCGTPRVRFSYPLETPRLPGCLSWSPRAHSLWESAHSSEQGMFLATIRLKSVRTVQLLLRGAGPRVAWHSYQYTQHLRRLGVQHVARHRVARVVMCDEVEQRTPI